MTNRIRDLVAGTRALESRLTAAVEQAAYTVTAPAVVTALEIVQRAVDDIALHVHPSGRGRYAFPFNTIVVTFVAATPEHQARLDAICLGPPTLHDRVVRRLESAGCIAADVDVSAAFVAAAETTWARPEFQIALARVDQAARPSRQPAPRVELIVTHGTADRGAYSFSSLPIAIGRGGDVRDGRQQLLRVNHVAFADGGDEVNASVSRRHARIELDADTRRPRLIDDNSAQGTSVVRHGKGIPVPRGSRGLVLQSGDEIVLGQARVRLRIGSAS